MRLQTLLSRRGVLYSAAAAAAVAVSGAGPGCVGRSRAQEDASRLADLVGTVEGREIIGRAYLESIGAESSAADQASFVYRDLGWFSRSASPEELRPRIAQLVLEDFRRGRVVNVEGWRLSETEARLCAISKLLESAKTSAVEA